MEGVEGGGEKEVRRGVRRGELLHEFPESIRKVRGAKRVIISRKAIGRNRGEVEW